MRSGLRRRRGEGADPLSLAGWLFAELAMVLVIIAFGTQFNPTPATPAATPTASTPSTTVPTSTPVPEPGSNGLALKPVKFVMHVADNGAGAAREFANQLAARRIPDGDIGLILLFGVARDGVLGNGVAVSKQFAGLIRQAPPPQLARDVVIREFLGGLDEGRPGDVVIELYQFTGER